MDDLTAAALGRLVPEGYAAAAVVETSPGSFQAWLRHAQPLPKELGTLAAKTLAERFGADLSAADWRRFGRAPGFTNRKPQHRNPQGLYPFARLVSHTGQALPNAHALRSDFQVLQETARQERAALRLSFTARPSRFPVVVSLSRFVRRHGIRAAPPPQTWRSVSPLVPKVCPSPTLQPRSPETIFRAMLAALARTATFNAQSQKRFAGLLNKLDLLSAAYALARAAGRNRWGFSLHPHPAIPASARRLRARSQVPPSGLPPEYLSSTDDNGVSRYLFLSAPIPFTVSTTFGIKSQSCLGGTSISAKAP